MVLGAEIMSKVTDWSDRATCVLFGRRSRSGASSREKKAIGGSFPPTCTRTVPCGSFSTCREGAQRIPPRTRRWTNGCTTLKWRATSFSKSPSEPWPKCPGGLKINGLTCEDIHLMIPHQANLRIIEAAAKMINFPMDKVFLNIEKYGNTSSGHDSHRPG